MTRTDSFVLLRARGAARYILPRSRRLSCLVLALTFTPGYPGPPCRTRRSGGSPARHNGKSASCGRDPSDAELWRENRAHVRLSLNRRAQFISLAIRQTTFDATAGQHARERFTPVMPA